MCVCLSVFLRSGLKLSVPSLPPAALARCIDTLRAVKTGLGLEEQAVNLIGQRDLEP